jgi:hypothetical protein
LDYVNVVEPAAPQVAGLIATYLSYEPTQKYWDGLKGTKRVEAIRDYLLSDDSSWTRSKPSSNHPKDQIRMIWNGAKEEDHKSAGTNSLNNPAPSPTPLTSSKKTKALSIVYQSCVDEVGKLSNT